MPRQPKIIVAAVAGNDDFWHEDCSFSNNNNEKKNYSKKTNNNVDGSDRVDLTSSSSSRTNNNNKEEENNNEQEQTSQFLQGEELKKLRSDLVSYRENLKWATAMNDSQRMDSLSAEIENKQMQDPEIVYKKAQELLAEAGTVSPRSSSILLTPTMRENLIQYWTEQAASARECLPRFQMEGYVKERGNEKARTDLGRMLLMKV